MFSDENENEKQALESSHLMMQEYNILQHLETGIILTNHLHEIEYINPACYSILQVEPDHKLLHQKLPEVLDYLFRHCDHQKRRLLKNKFLNHSDSQFTNICEIEFNQSLTVLKYHPTPDKSKHMLEITTRDRADLNPTDDTTLLKKIIDYLPIDLVVFDLNHKYLYVNKSAIQNDEYREWIIGKDDFEYCQFRNISNERAILRRRQFQKLIESKRPLEFEEETVGNSGEYNLKLRRFHPIFNEDGSIIFVTGYGLDITDRRNAELEMQKAKLETEKSAEAKEKFLANVSHELRTPLNGINGLLELLKQSELSQIQEKWLNLTIQSSNHLLKLVDELLDLYKINQGDSIPESEPFSVCETLQDIAETFKVQAENKGLDWIHVIQCRDIETVFSDRLRIVQILNNLISNAIKFTQTGFVKLIAEIQSTNAQSANLSIQIIDSGSGIDPKHHELIFEPFVKLFHDKKVKFEGTGLGLPITKKVVQSLHGSIQIKSDQGTGTHFTVHIPLKLSSGAQNLTTPSNPIQNSIERNIFIAEDHPVNRFLLCTQLHQAGHSTTEAESGAEALEALENIKNIPDIFIFDINLGDTTGDVLLNQIRIKFPKLAHIPAIALTANMIDDYKEKVLEAGFQGYISKPYKADELLRMIQNLTAQK